MEDLGSHAAERLLAYRPVIADVAGAAHRVPDAADRAVPDVALRVRGDAYIAGAAIRIARTAALTNAAGHASSAATARVAFNRTHGSGSNARPRGCERVAGAAGAVQAEAAAARLAGCAAHRARAERAVLAGTRAR